MKFLIPKGTTSKRVPIFVRDASKTDGSGLAGLVFNSTGLKMYYWREDEGNAGGTAVTLATATRGSFTSSGFIEKDATNLPGEYELGLPNAMLASGAGWVNAQLYGAANMVPVPLEIELTDQFEKLYFKLNTAVANFPFPMYDSSDHVTPKTGLTVTAQRRIDNGSYVTAANAVTEISSTGRYTLDIAAADHNGLTVAWKMTATGADPLDFTIVTQP